MEKAESERRERKLMGKASLVRKREEKSPFSGSWSMFVPTFTNASLIVLRGLKDASWHRSVSSSSSCRICDPLEVFPSRKEKLYTTMHSFLYEAEFTKDLNAGVHLPTESKVALQSPLAIPPLPVRLRARALRSDMQT